MILKGESLRKVLEELAKRNFRVFHACQLMDLTSYLQLGGIPSRQRLQERSLAYTRFDTDADDVSNRVFNKVFFNLQDFGLTFANQRTATPTAYGPINCVFGSPILAYAHDIAVCLRSAGVKGFNRDVEGLSLEEIQKIFVNSQIEGSAKDRWIRPTSELKSEFVSKIVTSWPEISCSIADEVAPFSGNLRYVLVDPYTFEGRSLKSFVEEFVKDLDVKVIERSTQNRHIYQFLWDNIFRGVTTFGDFAELKSVPTGVSGFLANISGAGLEYQFDRYASYLERGTIGFLKDMSKLAG